MASDSNNIFWFWSDKFLSNTVKLLSHYVSTNFFYWTPFPVFFFRLFTNQFDFTFFWPVWAFYSFESFLTAFHLFSEFLFPVLFLVLWMLVTVGKVKFSLQKILITFNKIPALLQILVTAGASPLGGLGELQLPQ